MLPIFSCGLGGRVGSGEQFMSWIAIDDFIEIIECVLEDERYFGAVNGKPSCRNQFGVY